MTRRWQPRETERRITLRFTALVVGILVLGIAAFVAVDTAVIETGLDTSLQRRAERTAARISSTPGRGLPGEARLLASGGAVIQAGELWDGISSPGPMQGFGVVESPSGPLRVYAAPLAGGEVLQMADNARPDVIDTVNIAVMLGAVVAVVGLAVYFVGLRFSRRALAPVGETIERLERFTADAGHELRTPLASVRASLDVAEKTGEWRAALARARGELDHASELVDRLLELARLEPQSLRVGPVDPLAVAERVAQRYPPDAAAVAHVEVTGVHSAVSADEILLERLIANLVDNAVRFADAGSVVTVSATASGIMVHDRGVVIAQSDLEHIFEPFYQCDVSRSSEEFGLGLAVCDAIVAAHGWRLLATSTAGQGTTFSVSF